MKKYNKIVNELLLKMTLKEKIGQLNQVGFNIDNMDKLKQMISDGDVGAFVLSSTAFAGNDNQNATQLEIVKELQRVAVNKSRLGIPLIFGRDVIHGHKTVFPIPLAMAASFNMQLIQKSFNSIAAEAYNDGVRWSFAPMLDIVRDPRWGRVIESPGEDPYLGMQFAKAVIYGFQGKTSHMSGKICACAKHYIGYGNSEGGRDYHKCEISEYSLRNYYLKAFKAAVDAGVGTVMSSFNEVSGQPVTSSRYLINDVLRNELGFGGFVVSDWDAIPQLINQGVAESYKECAELAITAGVDMEMTNKCYINYLEQLVQEGSISEQLIDDAVKRILQIKYNLGLFDEPYNKPVKINWNQHDLMARKMARESMVLLKNNNNILPLNKEKKICIIGDMKNEVRAVLGSWTLDGDTNRTITIEMGIRNSYKNITVVDRIEDSDVIICVIGESHLVTGEAHSVTDISVNEEQFKLVKKAHNSSKPVIGVLCFGRPVALQNVEPYLDAILYAWHSGSQIGNAVADLIFGKHSPSGRLPITFPRVTGQIPIYYNCPPSGRNVNEYYDKSSNINNYEDCAGSPMYPFGYGLSYTTFVYSDPKVVKADKNQVVVSIDVENCGNFDSYEVIQCYVRDCKSSMTRPIRELKGFEKKWFRAKQKQTILFKLDKSAFGFYNKDNQFVLEDGKFEIFIGENCKATNKVQVYVKDSEFLIFD